MLGSEGLEYTQTVSISLLGESLPKELQLEVTAGASIVTLGTASGTGAPRLQDMNQCLGLHRTRYLGQLQERHFVHLTGDDWWLLREHQGLRPTDSFPVLGNFNGPLMTLGGLVGELIMMDSVKEMSCIRPV